MYMSIKMTEDMLRKDSGCIREDNMQREDNAET